MDDRFFAPSVPNWQVDLPLLRRDLALKRTAKSAKTAAEAHHGNPMGWCSEDQWMAILTIYVVGTWTLEWCTARNLWIWYDSINNHYPHCSWRSNHSLLADVFLTSPQVEVLTNLQLVLYLDVGPTSRSLCWLWHLKSGSNWFPVCSGNRRCDRQQVAICIHREVYVYILYTSIFPVTSNRGHLDQKMN